MRFVAPVPFVLIALSALPLATPVPISRALLSSVRLFGFTTIPMPEFGLVFSAGCGAAPVSVGWAACGGLAFWPPFTILPLIGAPSVAAIAADARQSAATAARLIMRIGFPRG